MNTNLLSAGSTVALATLYSAAPPANYFKSRSEASPNLKLTSWVE